MPFSGPFSFVYKYGIKPALEGVDPSPIVGRADDTLTIKDEKVREIMERIRVSDFVIIDVTGGNPNVLWELGYAKALDKHIVLLSQKADLPFNIRGLDVQFYDLSVEGLERLKANLEKHLGEALPEVGRYRSSLLFALKTEQQLATIRSGLQRIQQGSVLQNLAKNELNRFADRVNVLMDGKFILRSEKPNSEIIQYFHDYISQLTGHESSFTTITHMNFWREISNQGSDAAYLMSNVRAADSGALIRRVFILDARTSLGGICPADVVEQFILRRIFQETTGAVGTLETRVFCSHEYNQDCATYENFGLLRKGTESLLFLPRYNASGRMTQTEFFYCDDEATTERTFADHKRMVDDNVGRFKSLLGRSEPLAEKHFTPPA